MNTLITPEKVRQWGACYTEAQCARALGDEGMGLLHVLDRRYKLYLDDQRMATNADRIWVGTNWLARTDRTALAEWAIRQVQAIPGRTPIPLWGEWADDVLHDRAASAAAAEAAWAAAAGAALRDLRAVVRSCVIV